MQNQSQNPEVEMRGLSENQIRAGMPKHKD